MKAFNPAAIVFATLTLFSTTQSITFAATTEEIAKGNCKVAAKACDDTIEYCSGKKDNHSSTNVIDSLRDASSACKTTFDYLSRNSSLSKKQAALCIEALNRCTKSCEAFTSDNNMKACADECRKAEGNLQKVVADNK